MKLYYSPTSLFIFIKQLLTAFHLTYSEVHKQIQSPRFLPLWQADTSALELLRLE